MAKGYTFEERFIMALYEIDEGRHEGSGIGDVALGKKLGFSPKQVRAICLQLAKANFIRRPEDDLVLLTEQGEELARSLLDD